MGPLPYPHRATFLASTLIVPREQDALVPYLARLFSMIVFDHLVRHPVITLGDHDDERLTDDTSQLIDAQHPQIEDSIDWLFRVSRRHEVLWFEISFDPSRPGPPILWSRQPHGPDERWVASPGGALSQQLDHCLAQWLSARRLPAVARLAPFSLADVRSVAERLVAADDLLVQGKDLGIVPKSLTQAPPLLPVPYLRVLAELSRDDARTFDALILKLDPAHPVARRNRYVTELVSGSVDRRAILPVIAEAPMYGKPHLSVWGEPFAGDRPLENMGVRHQGIASSLMPANPYACHNYSLQLAEHERREESYRWADRATVAAPQLGVAHLDCVRRLRQVGRPGQAFAEAQYRCREILDRSAAGKLSAGEWHAPHRAALLVAFVHLDVGRLGEAIELADEVMAQVPSDPASREAFAWAARRIAHWKADPALLARAYAWEGYHRGEVGRVLTGLVRGGLSDDEDAMMLIDALCAIGRADQAETAYWHCTGQDVSPSGVSGPGSQSGHSGHSGQSGHSGHSGLTNPGGLAGRTAIAGSGDGGRASRSSQGGGDLLGDGKARLAAAKALILTGSLDEALDQIQIVQLRRSQSRLEAEINRLLRLAAIRPAEDWERVIERRASRGAVALARLAARDLGDFVPGLDTEVVRAALGERRPLALDPVWIAELIAAVPAAQATAPAIVARLAPPQAATLAAADALAQDWWTVLTPSARDRDGHAAGSVLALGLALAHYLVSASGPPSPICGGYRHIATEALQLVRRSRYQIEAGAVIALLRLIDHLGDAPDWLLDPWLLRVERALDLEVEHGGYLAGLIADMPSVMRLLRGDERIGWELRLAHDLASDPSQYEPAAMLFARSARAIEGGSAWRAWSAAATSAPLATRLDVHAAAALANPVGVAAPWLQLAEALWAAGHRAEGFAAACHGIAACTAEQRPRALAGLAPAWTAAGIATPIDDAAAFERGTAAISAGRIELAVDHLRWACAVAPASAQRARSLAISFARLGRGHEALAVLARHERSDAPRMIGRLLAEHGHDADAVRILRYAARRFRTAAEWATLAIVAGRHGSDAVAVDAGRRAVTLGASDHALLAAFATSLYRIGCFVECEPIARLLIAEGNDRAVKLVGLHAMARALAGQGRHVEAHRYARAADELAPEGPLADELAETMERIIAQDEPAIRTGDELSMERQACSDLEAGRFDSLIAAVASPSWGIARIALAACEVRRDDESGIPVSPRALDAAVAILERSTGATGPDAVLARIRALRIRDNAFIQIDPPPPLGTRYTPEQFEAAHAERERHERAAAGAVTGAVTGAIK